MDNFTISVYQKALANIEDIIARGERLGLNVNKYKEDKEVLLSTMQMQESKTFSQLQA